MVNLVAFVIFLVPTVCFASPRGVYQMSVEPHYLEDSGHATNCGSVPFNFTWTPKVLKPSGKVTLKLEYTAPYDLSSGFVNASVFFLGDTEPFVGYADAFTCDKVKEYMPCPVKKGDPISQTQTITNLRSLSSYPGDYYAIVEVQNQNKEKMLCAKVTVKIQEG